MPKPTPRMVRRAKDARSGMVRIDITVPADLQAALKLIRSVTGIPVKEWIRWQLSLAVQLELARRPGALWVRPGSRVYRLQVDQGSGDPFPVPVATTLGGERCWVIEILPDILAPLGREEEARLDPWMRHAGAICDLSADEPNQLQMRHVLVPVADLLPRETYPWRSGLGSLEQAKRRERYRDQVLGSKREAALRYARREGESGPLPIPRG